MSYNQPSGIGFSAFNQERVKVSRSQAENIVQQINGPIVGIDRMSDEDLQRKIPSQYVIV